MMHDGALPLDEAAQGGALRTPAPAFWPVSIDQFNHITAFLHYDAIIALASSCRELRACCSRCQVIDTGIIPLSDRHVANMLRKFPCITSLKAGDASRLSPVSYRALASMCQNLAHLELDKARITDHGTFLGISSKLPEVRCLSLTGTFYVRGRAMLALANSATNLVKLTLNGFRQLNDEDVVMLGDLLPNLQELSLSDCTSLCNLSLSSRELRSLKLACSIHISSLSLICPALQTLDASWCTQLTDDAVTAALSCCPALTVLRLRGCSALTRQRLALDSSSTREILLRELDLSLCSNLVTVHVSCHHLKELNVTMCMNLRNLHLDLMSLTDLDLSMLKLEVLDMNCPSLTQLNLRGNYCLPPQSVRFHLPCLDVIDLCGTHLSAEMFMDCGGDAPASAAVHRPVSIQW